MILSQYGITLRRIGQNDIELIRQWRNHPDIRRYMAYRKYITIKMQQKWFESVNNKHNYYFLIEYKSEKIGVINVKNIDEKLRYGEGGIFIWNQNYIESHIPVFASMILLDFIFHELNYSTKSYVRILSSNRRAISYNNLLGYSLVPYQESEKNQLYVLTREDYEVRAAKLRPVAAKLNGGDGKLSASGVAGPLMIDALNVYFTSINSSK